MAADVDALAQKLALGGSELRFLLVHHKVSDYSASYLIDLLGVNLHFRIIYTQNGV